MSRSSPVDRCGPSRMTREQQLQRDEMRCPKPSSRMIGCCSLNRRIGSMPSAHIFPQKENQLRQFECPGPRRSSPCTRGWIVMEMEMPAKYQPKICYCTGKSPCSRRWKSRDPTRKSAHTHIYMCVCVLCAYQQCTPTITSPASQTFNGVFPRALHFNKLQ
jgi:hypothetical protein